MTAAHERPKGYRFARFPRLPARPVVPVTPGGVGLVQVQGPASWQPSYRDTNVPPEAEDAVVSYVLWFYSVARQQAQLPDLPPPPLSNASVQQAYWSAPTRAANGGDAVGDWANAVVVEADWPQTGSSFAPPGDRTSAIGLNALTDAVYHNTSVS